MMLLSIVPILISLFVLGFFANTFLSRRQDEKQAKKEGQARAVSAWLDQEKGQKCILRDGSSSSVYDVVMAAVAVQGAASNRIKELNRPKWIVITELPPGDSEYDELDVNGAMAVALQPELAFRDSNGLNRLRRSNRNLAVSPCDFLGYFNIGKLVNYCQLKRCVISSEVFFAGYEWRIGAV